MEELEEPKAQGIGEGTICDLTAVVYVGGADTVSSSYLPDRSIVIDCQMLASRSASRIYSRDGAPPARLEKGAGADRPTPWRKKAPLILRSSQPSLRLSGVRGDRPVAPTHTAKFVMVTHSYTDHHLPVSRRDPTQLYPRRHLRKALYPLGDHGGRRLLVGDFSRTWFVGTCLTMSD